MDHLEAAVPDPPKFAALMEKARLAAEYEKERGLGDDSRHR
jgi:hypothetical protein